LIVASVKPVDIYCLSCSNVCFVWLFKESIIVYNSNDASWVMEYYNWS